jgi:predicted NUDIX family phosphoesterase/dephospho-CoA kinase
MESEFISVARQVLRAEKQPMTPRDIWWTGKDKMGLFSDKIAGQTPWQTLKSKLSVHVRRNGDQSEFVRTGPGKFFLRELIDAQTRIYPTPPLRPPNPTENVLVFPTSMLDECGRFQGIETSWRKIANHVLDPKACSYLFRPQAEVDNRHKQVVTYIMVCRGSKTLGFKRGTYNWAEEFLRGCHCIGFGGHTAESDNDLFDREWLGIRRTVARELAEELQLPQKDRERLARATGLQVVGVLNDDSSDVGRRHFAFIFRYQVSDDPYWNHPIRGEKAITQLRWLDVTSPNFSLSGFEYWSQLCFRTYFKSVIKAQPSYFIQRKRPLLPPHILCIVGPIGSGKTETSAVLKKDYGYLEINTGQIVGQLIRLPPVPTTSRAKFQREAFKFIKRADGPKRLAKAILKKADSYRAARVLVDGVRHKKTLLELKRQAKHLKVGMVYVHTPPDLAFKFQSGRDADAVSIEEFFKRREDPVEEEVKGLLPLADGVLYNWEGRPMYQRSIHMMMRELGNSPTQE